MDITILAQSTREKLEPNKITQIQQMMDSSTHPKTMGRIMGYVGP